MPAEKQSFKVLFDSHTFDVGWQGTTTYLAGIINALPAVAAKRAPDMDLQIICAANQKQAVDRFVEVPYRFEPIRTCFAARNVFDIPRSARRCEANLIVSQYVRPFFSDCPTMSVIHDVLFLDFPESFGWTYRTVRKHLFRWAARRSSFVSTVSDYSAERISHHLGVEQDTVLVIPNAVDRAFSNAARARTSDRKMLRLLSVSRLERRKRHEWGIHALEALAARGITASYTIIGRGSDAYAEELREAVDAARTGGRLDVSINSGSAFSKLVQEYADADIFLCPSRAEGFGIPVIEAGAAGTPCVSTDGGALSELSGQFSGLMTAAEDHDAFINAVCAVAADMDAHHSAAQSIREEVANTYSWERAAQAYVDVFQRIAGTTR